MNQVLLPGMGINQPAGMCLQEDSFTLDSHDASLFLQPEVDVQPVTVDGVTVMPPHYDEGPQVEWHPALNLFSGSINFDHSSGLLPHPLEIQPGVSAHTRATPPLSITVHREPDASSDLEPLPLSPSRKTARAMQLGAMGVAAVSMTGCYSKTAPKMTSEVCEKTGEAQQCHDVIEMVPENQNHTLVGKFWYMNDVHPVSFWLGIAGAAVLTFKAYEKHAKPRITRIINKLRSKPEQEQKTCPSIYGPHRKKVDALRKQIQEAKGDEVETAEEIYRIVTEHIQQYDADLDAIKRTVDAGPDQIVPLPEHLQGHGDPLVVRQKILAAYGFDIDTLWEITHFSWHVFSHTNMFSRAWELKVQYNEKADKSVIPPYYYTLLTTLYAAIGGRFMLVAMEAGAGIFSHIAPSHIADTTFTWSHLSPIAFAASAVGVVGISALLNHAYGAIEGIRWHNRKFPRKLKAAARRVGRKLKKGNQQGGSQRDGSEKKEQHFLVSGAKAVFVTMPRYASGRLIEGGRSVFHWANDGAQRFFGRPYERLFMGAFTSVMSGYAGIQKMNLFYLPKNIAKAINTPLELFFSGAMAVGRCVMFDTTVADSFMQRLHKVFTNPSWYAKKYMVPTIVVQLLRTFAYVQIMNNRRHDLDSAIKSRGNLGALIGAGLLAVTNAESLNGECFVNPEAPLNLDGSMAQAHTGVVYPAQIVIAGLAYVYARFVTNDKYLDNKGLIKASALQTLDPLFVPFRHLRGWWQGLNGD